MRYTLKNFEKHFSEEILKRGRQYYDEGAVIEAVEIDENEWEIEVQGAKTYSVELMFDKKYKLEFNECSCPYFEANDCCKHEVAALYYLREITSIKVVESKEKKENKSSMAKQLKSALANSSKEILIEFITEHATSNKGFGAKFLMFAKRKEVEESEDYSAYSFIITQALKTAKGRYTSWNNDSLKELSLLLQPIDEKLKNALKEKHYLLVFHLSTAIIKEFSAMIYKIQGRYSQRMFEIHTRAYDAFLELLKTEMALEFKETIYDWLWSNAADTSYHFGDQKALNKILGGSLRSSAEKERYVNFLKQKIESGSTAKPDRHNHHYQANEVLKLHLDLLIEVYKKEERWDEANCLIIDHSKKYADFFNQSLEILFATKRFEELEQMIIRKIQASPYLKGNYSELLFRIAEQTNNADNIKKLAVGLYRGTGSLHYCRVYKKQFTPEEWVTEFEKFTTALKKAFVTTDLLCQFFLAENALDKIYTELSLNGNFLLLAKYSSHFFENDKAGYFELFKQSLTQIFPKTYWGSPNYNSEYRMIAESLNLLKQNNQTELLKSLVEYITLHYKFKTNLMKVLQPYRSFLSNSSTTKSAITKQIQMKLK